MYFLTGFSNITDEFQRTDRHATVEMLSGKWSPFDARLHKIRVNLKLG
jgi:hypothetical protein